MNDRRRLERDRLDGKRRLACDRGDHAEEARLADDALSLADPRSAGDLLTAHLARLRALEHLADGSGSTDGRAVVLERWRQAALEAFVALEEDPEADESSPAARRTALDPVAASLRRAEEALGVPLSPPAADLVRRERARATARPPSLTFRERSGDGLAALWLRDGRAWWCERFAAKFGVEPPPGWWVDAPASPMGGRVAADRRSEDWFDAIDEAAFADEMEARYRAERGLPARGEGWVTEALLASSVEAALPGVEVVRQARPRWLGGGQSLDLFVPSLELAIEYQGEQHFVPLEHWGGEAGLAGRRELDERKREACFRAGVRLVEWRYDEPVSVEAVRRRLGLVEA